VYGAAAIKTVYRQRPWAQSVGKRLKKGEKRKEEDKEQEDKKGKRTEVGFTL